MIAASMHSFRGVTSGTRKETRGVPRDRSQSVHRTLPILGLYEEELVPLTRWTLPGRGVIAMSQPQGGGSLSPSPNMSDGIDAQHREIPHHIAIIMDGNGRWARERGQIASAGHKAGIDALQRTVESCIEHGIGYLTVFALSVENNRNRDDQEVKFLISLIHSVVHDRLQKLHTEGVRLIFVGSIHALEDQGLLDVIKKAEILTQGNTQLILTVSLNFSGRDDIVQATKSLLKLVQMNQIDLNNIDVSTFANHLSMSHISEEYRDPDLLIRTGGEQRLSNFLLWQLAYSELYFSDTYWPDFDAEDLSAALNEYSKRDRRFGARTP